MHKDTEKEFDRLDMCDQQSKGCSVSLAEWLSQDNMDILKSFINEHFIDKKKLEEATKRMFIIDQVAIPEGFEPKDEESWRAGWNDALQDLKDRLL